MKRIGEGDSAAFREVYRRYSPAVYGYGLKLMKDRAQADDVVQEVWIKIVRLAASYRGEGSLKGWLLRVTRNTALNVFRARKPEVELKEEFLTEPSQDFETGMLEGFEVARVKKAIMELPDSQRVALLLWITERLSYDEIAGEMGLSLTAVKSLIFRARRDLETALGGAV